MQIVINKYLLRVQTSKKRNKIYVEWTKRHKVRIATKYRPIRKGKDGFVYDCFGEKHWTNRRAAGTPKFIKLSGNLFYSGFGDHKIRARLMDALKKDFIRKIRAQKPPRINPKHLPITIHWDIYCPRGSNNWDLDNLWFYQKGFIDSLRDCKIIPEDHVGVITWLSGPKYWEVESDDERKMVFTFKRDSIERVQKWL